MNKIILLTTLIVSLAVSPGIAKEIIAYCHLTDGYWQIWTMNPDGSNKRQITKSQYDKRDPVWMGDRVAYRTHNGEVYQVTLSGDVEYRILDKYNRLHSLDYNQKTNSLVFVRFDPRTRDISNIWIADSDWRGARLITRGPGLKYQPSISTDGQLVAYVQADADEVDHHIWVKNINDGTATKIIEGENLNMLPVFTADKQKIIFSSDRGGNGFDIYGYEMDSDRYIRLTKDSSLDTSPSLSGDDQYVFFVSNRSGNKQIWKIELQSLKLTQLTKEKDPSIDPAWADIDIK